MGSKISTAASGFTVSKNKISDAVIYPHCIRINSFFLIPGINLIFLSAIYAISIPKQINYNQWVFELYLLMPNLSLNAWQLLKLSFNSRLALVINFKNFRTNDVIRWLNS